MTVVWHMDNAKASHEDLKVLEEDIECLQSICNDEEIGKLKVNCGPRHEFLGMMLDHSEPGKIKVDMTEHVGKMVEEFEMECELPKSAKTPAAEHLFKINDKCEKLNEKMAGDFHTYAAKGLFICKQGRPDAQTLVAFLTARVKQPDQDDWKK